MRKGKIRSYVCGKLCCLYAQVRGNGNTTAKHLPEFIIFSSRPYRKVRLAIIRIVKLIKCFCQSLGKYLYRFPYQSMKNAGTRGFLANVQGFCAGNLSPNRASNSSFTAINFCAFSDVSRSSFSSIAFVHSGVKIGMFVRYFPLLQTRYCRSRSSFISSSR